MGALDRRLSSDYTVAELVSAIDEAVAYLGVEHRSYGCVGCDRCTRRAMLEIASAGIEELAELLEKAAPQGSPEFELSWQPNHAPGEEVIELAGGHLCHSGLRDGAVYLVHGPAASCFSVVPKRVIP